MDLVRDFIEFFLHIDKHLVEVIRTYGFGTYAILFAIIFCETGLVITPFLPGDSLLFAAGALAAAEGGETLNVAVLFGLLAAAAIIGDTVNYFVGKFVGERVFDMRLPFLKREYLERTHRFYEKYGGKTIIIARFVPIVRTFAPFVAGVGAMNYGRFIAYNVVGGIGWVAIFVFGGFLFGNISFVKDNFSFVTIAIILISVLPILVEFVRARRPEVRATAAPRQPSISE
ncbi:MAG: DedA family protein [Chloroflexi bacterium]|nr:DedA family protein [Chloroflexota bacterium]